MNIDIREETKAIEEQVEAIVEKILVNQDKFKISTFHLSELPESNNWENHPNIDPIFKRHVEKLDTYKKDCLYWFSCEDAEKATILNNALNQYRTKYSGRNDYRVVPTSNQYNSDTNIIYVGVRRGSTAKNPKCTNIIGRINQHLGYYKQRKTQGLQLLHWAKYLDIDVTLHVVHFNDELGSLLYVIEKAIAKELVPHCGRH
ncbi:hypothetical protein FNJ87_06025 [Nonlabens mediterrranea]|uniref:GIY-YIG domain-containing protein n=1 Tax=Nonlabens mediterrranea TaxID=1419947 RepID=A0ABS0A3I3_9FLAO|nr:hypothetical protein [Nonlabens mediterrranea]